IGIMKYYVDPANSSNYVVVTENTVVPTNATVNSVIYVGLEGAITIAGLGGLKLRVGVSDRGPLSFYVEASVPILLDPITGLTIDRFRGGAEFGVGLPDPSFPFGLRDPNFQPPGEIPLDIWRENLKKGVIAQIKNGAKFDASSFKQMKITAGADLY